jgi:hypothetical protein
MASVCDGGLRPGERRDPRWKRAATHWYSCERLARLYPRVHVDREAIFVRDGRVWTAAGVSTGIDMALAMVEEDHGRKLADTVASHLVLFAPPSWIPVAVQRGARGADPRGGSPWTGHRLDAGQSPVRHSTWPPVAHRAGMSVRTFHRSCLEALAPHPCQARREAPSRARSLVADDHAARHEGDRLAIRVRIHAPDEPGLSACAGRHPGSVPAHVLPGLRGDVELARIRPR